MLQMVLTSDKLNKEIIITNNKIITNGTSVDIDMGMRASLISGIYSFQKEVQDGNLNELGNPTITVSEV